MTSIVIVGASVAGIRTAQALRSEGFDGDIVLVDQERHPSYDKPPLSKAFLAGSSQLHEIVLLTDDEAKDLRVREVFGSAADALDPDARIVRLENGDALPYDLLVIATGSRARRPPWGESEHVHVLRTSADAERLREDVGAGKHIVVIGAGFIGAEAAATAVRAGTRVTMIDPFPAPMSRVLGERVGAIFARKYRSEGVDTRFGSSVHSLTPVGGGVEVELENGEVIAADSALVGIGAVVNTEWLAGSGLELADGVVCNSSLAVPGRPEIHAVGDVARWSSAMRNSSLRLEHWTNAVEQARVVARNIVHPDEAVAYETTEYVWSDQYDWKIQVVGRTGAEDLQMIGSEEDERFAVLYSEDGTTLTGGLIVNWPRALVWVRRGVGVRESRTAVAEALKSVAAPRRAPLVG